MSPILWAIIAGIAATIGLVIHYQIALKRHQRDLGKGGGKRSDDVVSLDEEEIEAKQFQQAPSKIYMIGMVAITCMLVVWFVAFGGTTSGDDGDLTYTELGIKGMCEHLLAMNAGKTKEIPAVLILPQREFIDYNALQAVEPIKPHPLVDTIVIDTLRKGKRYNIIGVEPSVPVTRKVITNQDEDLTPTLLRDIMRRYDEAQVVVSLVGFHKECGESVPASKDRSFYLAVFSREARLFQYVDLAQERAFDLAVLSNGLYNENTRIPDSPGPEELISSHFSFLTPANQESYRYNRRQVIMKDVDIK